jgi:hypothetical protein
MTGEPLQPYAAWEAGLKAMGYTLSATSTQGSALFVCDGKPSYRLGRFEPNEATACWMRRNNVVDARCADSDDLDYYDRTSDLPEFGPTDRQFRIIDCLQGSDEWDRLRERPTASNFGRIVSPARGDYSEQATAYAAEIVAKRMGLYVEPPPSFWMVHGQESEPFARAAYEEANGVEVQQAGFITPLFTDAYGGSPDGLVGQSGCILEIKCPAPTTLLKWIAQGVVPQEHVPQIQGLLLVTRGPWADFFAWHPGLTPFQIRVYADDSYQTKIAKGIYKLLEEVERIESLVSRNPDYAKRKEAEPVEQELDKYDTIDLSLTDD